MPSFGGYDGCVARLIEPFLGRCIAFTILELAVVIAIIALLSGLTLAILNRAQRRGNDQATRALLDQILVAAAAYDNGLRLWPHAGRHLARPLMWDVNGDGLLDGAGDSGLPAGYAGFLRMASAGAVPAWSIAADGSLQDRWRRRLRVAAPSRYVGLPAVAVGVPPSHCILPDDVPFGVYSLGRDGLDQTDPIADPGDDIRSW